MEQLGRMDVVPAATGVLLALKDAAGLTFILKGSDTFTLKSATAYNGSPTAMPTITNWYTNPQTNGSGAWTQQIQATASTITVDGGMAAVYVDAADLPSGAEWVEFTAAGSGTVEAYYGDLFAPAAPPSLPARSGSAS